MGDVTDNIPGLKGTADLKAYELLNEAKTEEECHKIVLDSYNSIYGNDEGAIRMLEQARLVWMVRSLDPEGRPVMWNLKGE
jgi:5'-3' exonuclease